MPEIRRLTSDIDEFALEFVEQEKTPRELMRLRTNVFVFS
jgi:hypothetical protein